MKLKIALTNCKHAKIVLLSLIHIWEMFIRYMEDGPYKEQEIRQAYLKAVYLLLDTVREIDGDAYSQLQNADLLSKCTEAVTLREMEQNYRDGMALVCSPRRMKEDISNYTIKRAIN